MVTTKPQPTIGLCTLRGDRLPCELDALRGEILASDRAWEEARRICCVAVRRRLLPSKPLQVTAACSLYAACREFDGPVTMVDLANAANVSRVEIGRGYKLILDRIGLSPTPLDHSKFALKVASTLGVSREATAKALDIEKEAADRGLEDRTPMTIAAASVYLACLSVGEMVTQSDVADAAGVSVVSVRECSRAMRGLATST